MGFERVAPDWPPLTAAEVNAVLGRYPGFSGGAQPRWHSPRPFSAACIADTASGAALFVKRHHRQVRDQMGLAEEHRFIAHLRRAGLPVPEVLNDRDGGSAVEVGCWAYEVHRIAAGQDLYRDALSWSPFQAPEHAFAAGRTLAALHQAATGYDAPARPRRTLQSGFTLLAADDLLAAMRAAIADSPSLAAVMAARPWQRQATDLLLPHHRRLLAYRDRFAPLWCHNDWHASNLLWQPTAGAVSVSAIVDFGLADLGCALSDLAIAIERSIVQWLLLPGESPDLVDVASLKALLDGYVSLRPLTRRDGLALAALLPLAHVEFALSEADYFAAVLEDPAKVELAMDHYLFGHAAWFGTPLGEGLQQRVRRLAASWPN
jgi:Ser/Thr protein kinase RdoA (MazF antagonist)